MDKFNFKKNSIILIDTSLFIYKFLYNYNDIFYGFISQIFFFLKRKVLPIYIFDGVPPIEKKDILLLRNNKKKKIENKILLLEDLLKNVDKSSEKYIKNYSILLKLKKKNIKIDKKLVVELKQIFNHLNIEYFDAKTEADYLLAKLSYTIPNSYVLSNDTDMLALGCINTLRIENNIVSFYNLNMVLKNLKLSKIQFRKLCIYFGCDFFKPIPKLNISLIYLFVKFNISDSKILSFINLTYIRNRNYKILKNDIVDINIINRNILTKEYFDKAFYLFNNESKNEIDYNINTNINKVIDSNNIFTNINHSSDRFIKDKNNFDLIMNTIRSNINI